PDFDLWRPVKTLAELARRHPPEGLELAIEVGEVGTVDLIGDVRDRLAAVDEQRAGLADAELGDVIAHRQPVVATEESVKTGLAERGDLGELGDHNALAIIGVEII